MTINKCKRSQPLKDGECGGCGTFENVTDNSCPECDKGYIDPTPQEMVDANEYYGNYVKPLAKIIDDATQLDPVQMWKKLRVPADYSLEAELKQADTQGESTYNYGSDTPPLIAHVPESREDNLSVYTTSPGLKLVDLYRDKETFMAPAINTEGLDKYLGTEGGLKRGELDVISSHNPLRP